MRTILLALLTVVSFAAGAEPQLTGRLQSDRELTMRFARERSRLEEKSLLFLDQMMGRLTLEFGKREIKSHLPDWESVAADGAKSQLVGFTESRRFKIVATTDSQVAVVSAEPVTGRQRVTVYNFDGPNTMWVYVGDDQLPEISIREYFVRVK